MDMLLTGFDAPVEQALYLDRALKEHGLLQAIARVNRRFSHEWDGVATEKSEGIVVDYHGVSVTWRKRFPPSSGRTCRTPCARWRRNRRR